MQRAISMKECRCHSRGFKGEDGLTQSIVFNEEEVQTPTKQKVISNAKIRNWSVASMRKSLLRNESHEENVKINKLIIRQDMDRKEEQRIMKEK